MKIMHILNMFFVVTMIIAVQQLDGVSSTSQETVVKPILVVLQEIIAPFQAGYGYTEEEKNCAYEKIAELELQLAESSLYPESRDDHEIQKLTTKIREQKIITGQAWSDDRKYVLGAIAASGAAVVAYKLFGALYLVSNVEKKQKQVLEQNKKLEILAQQKSDKEEAEKLAQKKAEREKAEKLAQQKAEKEETERLARQEAARQAREKVNQKINDAKNKIEQINKDIESESKDSGGQESDLYKQLLDKRVHAENDLQMIRLKAQVDYLEKEKEEKERARQQRAKFEAEEKERIMQRKIEIAQKIGNMLVNIATKTGQLLAQFAQNVYKRLEQSPVVSEENLMGYFYF